MAVRPTNVTFLHIPHRRAVQRALLAAPTVLLRAATRARFTEGKAQELFAQTYFDRFPVVGIASEEVNTRVARARPFGSFTQRLSPRLTRARSVSSRPA